MTLANGWRRSPGEHSHGVAPGTPPSSSEGTAVRDALKVIVVDDSELVLEATRLMLEAEGFHVVCLNTPIGVQARVAEEMPDAVLCDLQMASMSGERVISALKRGTRTSQIPVLIYSDRPMAELQRAAREAGADDYVAKGGDGALLAMTLRRFAARGGPKPG